MGSLLDPTESQAAYLEGRGERRKGRDRRRGKDDVGLLESVREWCRGKSANARLPLGVWFAMLFLFYFYDQEAAARIDILNAGLHKLGHWVWGLLVPDTPIAGGWLLQLGVPVLAMFWFYRRSDYFGVALTFAWFGTAMLWNAPYCLRAPEEAFPPSLLPMNEPIHDWHTMLGRFNIMEDAGEISDSLRWGGLMALAFGIYFLGSQIYFMYTLEERRKESDRRMAQIGAGR